jgi:hypothetical protein
LNVNIYKSFDTGDEVDSGRSTPEHLKKYSGSKAFDGDSDDEAEEDGENNDEDDVKSSAKTSNNKSSSKEKDKSRRARTFSETLKLLDDDILAELDVN